MLTPIDFRCTIALGLLRKVWWNGGHLSSQIGTGSNLVRSPMLGGDWEHLFRPGVNGLLNVVILAHWWAQILEERGCAGDETYSWFVSDVAWVLSQLTVVACERGI